MKQKITINTERIDDVPLLIAHQKKMNLPELLDKSFPSHGNRKGLSIGWLTTLWLTYIISESDHRLNQVQDWAKSLQETLKKSSGEELEELDFTDDRLGDVLQNLSDDEKWETLERELNNHTIRVYNLSSELIRIDSTTSSSYRSIVEDGLFQYGYSKDKRPDLPQLKVNLATLDPLGMPLATSVLKGNEADDSLYIPAVKEINQSIQCDGKLYVGDSKMGSKKTRLFIDQQKDYYLCPLSLVQLPQEELDRYILRAYEDTNSLQDIYREKADGKCEKIARGYHRLETQQIEVDGELVHLTEQHFVVQSFKMAETNKKSLMKRLEKAKQSLENLNVKRQGKKKIKDIEQLKQAVEDILISFRVEDLFSVECREMTKIRSVRAYKDRPTRHIVEPHFRVNAQVNQQAVEEAILKLGWRVYATNAPENILNIEKATIAYRNEYIIEHEFGRLKGKSLSLSPVYLQRDDHATGLVRLLSIGLRVMTLLEFIVRSSLKQQKESLAGLYAGNPKRTTDNPTTERLLEAFKNINLTILNEFGNIRKFVSALNPIQENILKLLGFSSKIYNALITDFDNPP